MSTGENNSAPAGQSAQSAAGHPTATQIRRWRRYLAEERLEADTYRDLSRRRDGEERAILEQLVAAEGRHEAHWLNLLGDKALPAPRASIRSRVLSALARSFGSVFVLAMMQRAEQRTDYDDDEDVPASMAADEHIHGEVVRGLAARSRSAMSGTFRAAIFGANDGLVSNLALMLGVAATGAGRNAVLTAGLAGLLAGALSMAAGEYVSVKSQRELLEASDPDPDAGRSLAALDMEANELALVYRARGDSEEAAQARAAQVMAELAAQDDVEMLERQTSFEEIGTGLQAASSSFLFFAAGALIPVLPFLFGITGVTGVVISSAMVGIALLVTGGIVGVLSGQAPLPRAFRQLAIGYGAAAVTYGLGWLFGTAAMG